MAQFKGVLVTFDGDLPEEQADLVIAAIRQIRGVGHVASPLPTDYADHMARFAVRMQFIERFRDLIAQLLTSNT